MTVDVELALLIAVGVLLVVVLVWLGLLQYRLNVAVGHYRRLVAGTSAETLQGILDAHLARVDAAQQRARDLTAFCNDLEVRLQRAVQKVGVVRFNPFEDMGGNQSFVVALLDNYGDGVVLSSLHSRAETRIYAKPIFGGKSTFQLSEEERQAIARANASATRAVSR